MDEKRVVDYFVVAGLAETPLPLEEFSNEAAIKPTFKQDPITDITIVNKSLGEKIPKGFQCIERTPLGFPADLNHGSIRCHEMYVCYKRGRDRPPLTDIGVLYEGKEKLIPGCEVVHSTAFGHPANINNGSGFRIYVTFRRALDTASSDTFAVTDICVILSNKNEEPPLAYNRISKNLNKGVVGSDVFLCYKKAMNKTDVLAYKPEVLDRYPREDYDNFPMPDSVPMFALPMGATVECWSAKAQHPLPVFSTFILTGQSSKIYGAAVTFYEEYEEASLSDLQLRYLGLKNKHIREQYRVMKTVHTNKSICLLSHWPFFDAFKKFLSYLYKISITGPHNVPLERHISHFMYDVPYPSPQRPRILVQLNNEALSLCMPEHSPLPQSGASFITLLKNVGPENCLSMLLYILLECKILIHSLRPAVLTGVAEAVTTMIFPFHWQCPYIPLCPLSLSDMLSAPCPFIVGIDSRYFDLYDPPSDVICVDLDTNRICMPEDKKTLSYKLLPKKPARVLQESLHRLFDSLVHHPDQAHTTDEISLEMAPIDHDFKRKKKEMQMELEIQEVFLRFTASILKGYKHYLNPILKRPTVRATDASVLFDMQNFLKSRDKAYAKFFHQLMKTQMFFRFIEERSFVSDEDASLAFFDECTETVDEMKDEPKLIEIDHSHASERTVFITPPEPTGLPEGFKYSYNGFPVLKPELFLTKQPSTLSLPGKPPLCPSSPLARRSKQEIRSAQKTAQQHITHPQRWAKCLLSYCYSLWFIHLPAFVDSYSNKMEAFKIAYAVLQKMHDAKLSSPDEMCYRVLMQLCGQYNKPGLAIKVFLQMKKYGIQPNAITYGYYNKVMLEAKWPSRNAKGVFLWTKIRNVILGLAQFRRALRRRSMSLNSNSGSEYDQISRTSVDSYFEELRTLEASESAKRDAPDSSVVNPAVSKACIEESLSTGGASDRGYSSMTQEDVKRISQILTSNDVAASDVVNDAVKSKDSRPGAHVAFCTITRSHSNKRERGEMGNRDSNCRRRVGSIVRRSGSTTSSGGSFDTLKGSIIDNSAGLLMVSQSSLDNHTFSLSRDVEEFMDKKRRRHKSAGEFGKMRSNSLFASWRPRHASGDDKLLMRFSDLQLKDGVDDIAEIVSTNDSEFNNSAAYNKRPRDEKDSGVELNENHMLFSESDEHSDPKQPHFCHNTVTNGAICDLSSSLPVDVGEKQEVELLCDISTPCSEKDLLGPFSGDSLLVTADAPLISFSPNRSPKSLVSLCTSTPFPTASNHSEHTDTDGMCKQCNDLDSSPSPLDSVVKLADSLLGPPKKKPDLGRTSSSPNCLADLEETRPNIPVKSQSMDEDNPPINSTLSLNEMGIREKTSEYLIRRTQSLRKTNEAITGFLKFAARGARGAVSKLNEFKQSMTTTPVKTGSNASLAKSIDELNGETGDESSGATVQSQRRFSQDMLSLSENSTDGSGGQHASQISFGSAPSPTYLDSFAPMKEFSDSSIKSAQLDQLWSDTATDVAMDVEMSSCSRCARCHCLMYDEEIMAGWTADESNLNTSCQFCPSKCVPHLQIYVKDWRTEDSKLFDKPMSHSHRKTNVVVKDEEYERRASVGSSHSASDIPQMIGDSMNGLDVFPSSPDSHDELPSKTSEPEVLPGPSKSVPPGLSTPDNYFDFKFEARRRTTSECLTHSTDMASSPSSNESIDTFGQARLMRTPLSISIDEDEVLQASSTAPDIQKEFMSRSASSIAPIVVPYLSPLVLRKEIEYILEHEGDQCLSSSKFVDEHPIIYWNLVWYFKRIDVPSHLLGFLLTASSITKHTQNCESHHPVYDSRHVSLRPMWDNVRIHDEVGLPLYTAWESGHHSSVVDALVTESQPVSRPVMHQIISNIQCNDVLSPIKLIANSRRRVRKKKHQFRSLYREILFLAFSACGRENIDHDAFDREFCLAFAKLTHAEERRLQPNDNPRTERVVFCRRAFGDLEI